MENIEECGLTESGQLFEMHAVGSTWQQVKSMIDKLTAEGWRSSYKQWHCEPSAAASTKAGDD